MRFIFRFIAMALVISAAVFNNAFAREITLGVPLPPDQATAKQIETFRSYPNFGDEGITIKQVPLGSLRMILRGLIEGEVDIGFVSYQTLAAHKFGDFDSPVLGGLLAQPFQFMGTPELFQVEQSPFGDAVLAEINRTGLIGLSFWNRGQSRILSKMPIRTAEDFKGLKIRSFDRSTANNVLVALGARETPMAFGETMYAFQQRAIDAVEATPDRARRFLREVQGTGSVIAGYRPLIGFVLASGVFWAGLSEREKSIIKRAAEAAANANREIVLSLESEFQAASKEGRISVVNLVAKSADAVVPISNATWSVRNDPGLKLAVENFELVRTALTGSTRPKRPTRIASPPSNETIPVLFVTDRDDTGDSDLEYRFGSKRNPDQLSCGQIEYPLPTSRRNMGEQFIADISAEPTDLPTGQSACTNFIGMQAEKLGKDRVLLFIHGFNNTFDDAIRRAIGMALDTQFDGLVLVWSWPAEGRVNAYFRDEDSVRWSRPHLLRFLRHLVHRPEIERLDIISHSMGGRLALLALEDLTQAQKRDRVRSVIFAAPDEAQQLFVQGIGLAGDVGKIRTLYASKYDRPLYLSGTIHKATRAGIGGEDDILVASGIESIDVTDVEAGYFESWVTLSHAHVFTVPQVIQDLTSLLARDHTAEQRGLPNKQKNGMAYWFLEDT